MRKLLCALAVAALASCAGPRAYSGATSPAPSAETTRSSSEGAGAAEPYQATFSTESVFSTDYLENERHAWEAWEAGG